MKEASHQGKELISHSTKRIPESRSVPNYTKGSVTSAFTFAFFTCKELLMNDLKSGQEKRQRGRKDSRRKSETLHIILNDLLEGKISNHSEVSDKNQNHLSKCDIYALVD